MISGGAVSGKRCRTRPGGLSVAHLMWLSVMARSGVANVFRACARLSRNPGRRHWKALLQIAAYAREYDEIHQF